MTTDPTPHIGTLITQKRNAIFDYQFQLALSEIPWKDWLLETGYFNCKDEFLDKYDQWIHSSELNSIKGLDRFKRRDVINGTTQTFDEIYYKYSDRTLRVFRGEYAYHQRVCKDWEFLDDEDGNWCPILDISASDYIIVSAPFCSSGDIHPKMYEMFDRAYEVGAPVIVDCAYFGTCTDIHLDLTHPAIESVSFSLTKGLGLGNIRSGIRYSNIKDTLPISQHNDYNHTVLSACQVGMYMMDKFSPDFQASKYQQWQKDLCNEFGMTPTKCMHLALVDTTKKVWKDFVNESTYHHAGIRELLKHRRKGLI